MKLMRSDINGVGRGEASASHNRIIPAAKTQSGATIGSRVSGPAP
jgi:hypothetical protein